MQFFAACHLLYNDRVCGMKMLVFERAVWKKKLAHFQLREVEPRLGANPDRAACLPVWLEGQLVGQMPSRLLPAAVVSWAGRGDCETGLSVGRREEDERLLPSDSLIDLFLCGALLAFAAVEV